MIRKLALMSHIVLLASASQEGGPDRQRQAADNIIPRERVPIITAAILRGCHSVRVSKVNEKLMKVEMLLFRVAVGLVLRLTSTVELACPKGTTAYSRDGVVQECTPGKPETCVKNGICYYDGPQDRHVCCVPSKDVKDPPVTTVELTGSPSASCLPGEKAYVDKTTGQPKRCSSGKDCPNPFTCSGQGSMLYCCLRMGRIEPPPTGCPWGTRPLKDRRNQNIPCHPSEPNTCPGDTLCYHDSVTKSNHCCGKDPGRGCPSGTKPFEVNKQIIKCVPGDLHAKCPQPAVCHWSYLTDNFQCCQKDNGICPRGMVAYMDPASRSPKLCTLSQPFDCPQDYACQAVGSTTGLCCGRVGQCPFGSSLQLDAQGKARSCLVGDPEGCSPPGRCLQAVGGPVGQYLCCVTVATQPSATCPFGYTLEDGVVKLCSPTYHSCKPTSSCLPSPGQPNTYLCCQPAGTTPIVQYACPAGFTSVQLQPILCVPSQQTCPLNSVCLEAVGYPAVHICCVQSTAVAAHCPPGYSLQDGRIIECRGGAMACRPGAYCMQSMVLPTLNICCVKEVSLAQCPAGFKLQRQAVYQCTPGVTSTCDPDSLCLLSLAKDKFICCTPTSTTYQLALCPVGWLMEGTTAKPCIPLNPSACAAGSSCLAALGLPNVFICCTRPTVLVKHYTCPQKMTIYLVNNRPIICNAFTATCPEGTFCVSAANDPQVQICCRPTSIQQVLNCPPNTMAYIVDLNPVMCDPITGVPCPVGYSCQSAVNSPKQYICCSVTQPVLYSCPGGGVPYQLQSVVYQCSYTEHKPCPPNYSCVPAIGVPSILICCPGVTIFKCPNRFDAILTSQNSNVFCQTAGQSCPSQSQCLSSAENTQIRICCKPTSSEAFCPAPMVPLYINGQVQFCFGPGSSCPVAGYTCVASTVLIDQYVCCSSSVELTETCANGQPAYKPSSVPFYCDPTLQQCPPQYECLPSKVSGRFLCCLTTTTVVGQWSCQSGRQPYPDANKPQFCSAEMPTCPSGTLCEQSNVPSFSICCFAGLPMQKPKCPNGWSSITTETDPVLCSGLADSSCPQNGQCVQSDQPNVYLCCRWTFGGSIGCQSGQVPFLLSAGKPQLCTQANPLCPPGYTCQLSTLPNTYICCKQPTAGSLLLCQDGSVPFKRDGVVFKCSAVVPCPPLYTCQTAMGSLEQVCCRPGGGNGRVNVCGPSQQAYMVNDIAQRCEVKNPSCPIGFSCQQGKQQIESYFCCQSAACPTGIALLNTNGQPRFCNPSYSSCPVGSFCQESSNLGGNYVCCMPSGGVLHLALCIGRETFLYANGNPKQCSMNEICPTEYECSSFTTTGQSLCCSSVTAISTWKMCPNGDPYRDPITKQFHYCSKTNYACPQGFVCNQMSSMGPGGEQYLCCSAKAACQQGWLPYIDRLTNRPNRCSPNDPKACNPPGPPYKCQQSTVPGEYLCCIESKIAMSEVRASIGNKRKFFCPRSNG
ncbi:Lustrin cystein domain containing protein [Trichuris trichiura]|uniref:Lustrin cystein domain containing protein n=1 Tax=Trichuris trichiura TaxID=36087 RepID=A0A077Z225_TRITR|nr:Lustrin cystein domain containing protein [Trichuris trichiura]